MLITAPSDRHLEIVAQVAAAGLPILCEKPCGLSSTEIRAAEEVVERLGVPFQVAYWRRYVPALQALRTRILDGELGDTHLFASFQWDGQPPATAFRAHSGGIFIDMGVHEFDQIRWLSGQEFGESSVVTPPLGRCGRRRARRDSAQAIAPMSGGATAFVSLGRYFPGGDMARLEVFGTRDAVRIDFLDPKDGERAQLDALARQAEGFATFAAGGPRTGASIQDAAAALEAAERAKAAIRPLQAAVAGGGIVTGVPDLRIGIVGYGGMGRAHSYGYRAAPNVAQLPMRPVVKLISGRDETAVAAAAAAYGAEAWTTDWRELVGRADIDMVDICSPPGTHAEIAEAAAAAGKAVLSEKPLGASYQQAHAAWAAVERAGVRNAIGFNYRRLPAVALMRRMVADGTIGDVRLWRAIWLSDEFTDASHAVRLAVRPGDGRHHDRGPREPSHRHGPLDGRADRGGHRPVGDVHQAPAGSGRRPAGHHRRRLLGVDPVQGRRAGHDRDGPDGDPPTLRLHRRGERDEGHPRLRVSAPERAALRRRGRRPRALWDASHPGRAPESPVRGAWLADRPGHRLRRDVREPGGRPGARLAQRGLDTELCRRTGRPGRVRRDGVVGRREAMGQGRGDH